MKEFTEQLPFDSSKLQTLPTFTEDALFFDIETTGFSAKHNKIYFIGCVYRKGDTLFVVQFFSENQQDEPLVLTSFLTLCNDFHTTITFNGLGFDIPFIRQRCDLLEVPENLMELSHLDIFKVISPIKKIFKLPNIKQKTLEQYLGLNRKDLYSGGELINVYHEYCKDFDEDKLYFMQLHNKEDVLGMIEILPILAYSRIFAGDFTIASTELSAYQEYEGFSALELIFTLSLSSPLPRRFSYGRDDIYLTGFQDTARLKVRIYQGELKYFYSNYKDYYYLPQEDVAIHKSVAFYVDKNFRTKAKAATCYSKKSGRFLPQYHEVFSPYFKLEYHDKVSYVEMTDEFMESKKEQQAYVLHLIGHLCS